MPADYVKDILIEVWSEHDSQPRAYSLRSSVNLAMRMGLGIPEYETGGFGKRAVVFYFLALVPIMFRLDNVSSNVGQPIDRVQLAIGNYSLDRRKSPCISDWLNGG